MRTDSKNGKVTVYPEGRIDSNTADGVFKELEEITAENEGAEFEINMEAVEYISSAGLRSFMKLQKSGISMKLTELSPSVYEIFEVTGFTEILDIKKAYRRISVDGCEVIGRGFYGTVYRIDDDTIVKAYSSPDSLSMIENEQKKAKQAFLNGIPTAISYDIVRIGDSYGSVFEMLKANTFNDLIKDNPEDADNIIKTYVDFIKQVHETEMPPGELHYARDNFLQALDVVRKYLSDDEYEILKGYLQKLPDDNHVIHGDFQMKNVMMVDGEPMLIDMDTLAVGQPIFDLAGLYVSYKSFVEDEPGNCMMFLGIPDEMGDRIWNGIIDNYFSEKSAAEKESICDKIKLAAAIRFLYILEISDYKNSDLGQVRIEHTKEHIKELIPKVDSLLFP
ncbi:TIGR02172 family protein [Butyrivibrio sp. ob235]|uniref:phosphotransferase n=1 Tax=Butyrivibrio sp. ob235 TaxID=1761780 RepID=UPI0008B7E52F|nr:phosphotransferase [Butyrivibrio sp. ob235]SEM04587.1 TIGR02172 family protein [Butyrivibrio sp. ob235]